MKADGVYKAQARGRALLGISLIEVLLSMALLGVVITGFLATYQAATRDGQHQYRAAQAVVLLDSVTEQLILSNSDHADLALGTHMQHYSEGGQLLDSSSGAVYQVTWTVSNSTWDNVRSLDLSVRWTVNGMARTIRWTTWRN